MTASAQPLIRLDGIKKVFYTDEVETHALAGIHLEIQQGDQIQNFIMSQQGKCKVSAGKSQLHGLFLRDLPLTINAVSPRVSHSAAVR